jgi:hypothetical protein
MERNLALQNNQNDTKMKLILLAGALLLATLTTKAFAAEVPVTPKVLHEFEATFRNATGVQWSVLDHLFKAEFTIAGQKTVAFFNSEDGRLVATSRYITMPELPRVLQNSLKEQAAVAPIAEIYEVVSDESWDYFATMQQGDKIVILKATSTKWEVYKKR